MHPEFCRQLVSQEVQEAVRRDGLLDENFRVVEADFPHLYVQFTNLEKRARLIRFECTNYDFQPIAIEPVDPATRLPLQPNEWMLRDNAPFPPHPLRGGMPFLCLQGTRDYYFHDGHQPNVTGDRWERWRGDLRIPDLIQAIKSKFTEGRWK